jgi:RHS repeat-associated protein
VYARSNTTFAYDPTNKLTSRTLPNGVVITSQYDGLNRLTRLTHAKGANTLADFQYQFNAVNNITQMSDGAGTHNYSYDPLDRLTAATHLSQTNESYTYDDVGNRTASQQGSSYTYQTFNRLVAANGASYGYDANGNLTSKTDASGSWTYSWDYENRLKQASKSGGVVVSYAYDALGRRIQRTSSTGGTTKFVYDGADVMRDLDGTGATVADYLNGSGIDNKLRQTASGVVSYFLTDHLGTTRALTDAGGNVTSTLDYDSFGNVTGGSAATRYGYTGREADSDAALMFYRARWYGAQAGRFISEDPIAFAGRDLNFYAYVKNNPIGYRDPSGLERLNYVLQPGKPAPPIRTNPVPDVWVYVEGGGGGQVMWGANGSGGLITNLKTGETCSFVKVCVRYGAGVIGEVGLKAGGSIFGPHCGKNVGGWQGGVVGELSSPEGGGSIRLGYGGGWGGGMGIGPNIGLGFSLSGDGCYQKIVKCWKTPCECQ